jgi:hypothetical protein
MRHPEFYYGRAEEARSLVQDAIDPETRKILIQRAAEYENLAKLAIALKSEELANKIKVRKTRPHLKINAGNVLPA